MGLRSDIPTSTSLVSCLKTELANIGCAGDAWDEGGPRDGHVRVR